MRYFLVQDQDGQSVVRVPKGKELADFGYDAATATETTQPRITKETRDRELRQRRIGSMTVEELEAMVRRLIVEAGQ